MLPTEVRASSQTKGLERGCVRLERFARVRLLRHALPIFLLILREKTDFLQSTFPKALGDAHASEFGQQNSTMHQKTNYDHVI